MINRKIDGRFGCVHDDTEERINIGDIARATSATNVFKTQELGDQAYLA